MPSALNPLIPLPPPEKKNIGKHGKVRFPTLNIKLVGKALHETAVDGVSQTLLSPSVEL